MVDLLPFRRFARRTLNVEFTVRDIDDVHGGEINFDAMDISEGGVFLRSALLFEIGERLDMSFMLPDDRDMIHVRARVVWVAQDDSTEKGQPGLGIEFVDISDEERTRINDFISKRAYKLQDPHE